MPDARGGAVVALLLSGARRRGAAAAPDRQAPLVGGLVPVDTTLHLRRAEQKLAFTAPDALRGGVFWGEAQFSP